MLSPWATVATNSKGADLEVDFGLGLVGLLPFSGPFKYGRTTYQACKTYFTLPSGRPGSGGGVCGVARHLGPVWVAGAPIHFVPNPVGGGVAHPGHGGRAGAFGGGLRHGRYLYVSAVIRVQWAALATAGIRSGVG